MELKTYVHRQRPTTSALVHPNCLDQLDHISHTLGLQELGAVLVLVLEVNINHRVVNEVLTNMGLVLDHGDVELLEVSGGSDTRKHEEVGRVHCTTTVSSRRVSL